MVGTFSLAAVAVVVVSFALVSTRLPAHYVNVAASSILNFQIMEGPDAGLFRETTHTGTTNYSAYGTFASLHTAKNFDAVNGSSWFDRALEGRKKARIAALGEQLRGDRVSMKNKMFGIALLHLIQRVSLRVVDMEGELKPWHESNSGFRWSIDETASLFGSYCAITALSQYTTDGDKIGGNGGSKMLQDTRRFLLSLRSRQSGGFHSRPPSILQNSMRGKGAAVNFDADVSIESTWTAVMTLKMMGDESQIDHNLARYLASRHNFGDGFANSRQELSNCVDNLRGIHLLHLLRNKKVDIGAIDPEIIGSFIWGCFGEEGLTYTPGKDSVDITATYLFSRILADGAGDLISLSSFRWIIGLGKFTVAISAAIFGAYFCGQTRLQFSKLIDWNDLVKNILLCFIFSVSGLLAAQRGSAVAVVSGLFYAIILLVQAIEIVDAETWGVRDRSDSQTALVTHALLFAALHLSAFGFLLRTTRLDLLPCIALVTLDLLFGFLAAVFAASRREARTRSLHASSLFYRASYLGWLIAFIGQFSLLYIFSSRLIIGYVVMRDNVPALLMLLPQCMLVSTTVGAALGTKWILGNCKK